MDPAPGGPPPQSPAADRPKPEALLALGPVCAGLFAQLKSWFDVPATVELNLESIDADQVVRDLRDPQMVAAFAMRKLQALHLLSIPGIATRPDVATSLIDSVLRALVEAPRSQLHRRAGQVNWDQEWAALDAGLLWREAPEAEARRFIDLLKAVVRARVALEELLCEGNPVIA